MVVAKLRAWGVEGTGKSSKRGRSRGCDDIAFWAVCDTDWLWQLRFHIDFWVYFRILVVVSFKYIFLSFTDVSAPVFSNCPSHIVATADRGTTSTHIMWSHPSATDNSGLIPNITHYGKQPGDSFPAGEHNIRYLASDKSGNIAECKFKVFVSGNLPMFQQSFALT